LTTVKTRSVARVNTETDRFSVCTRFVGPAERRTSSLHRFGHATSTVSISVEARPSKQKRFRSVVSKGWILVTWKQGVTGVRSGSAFNNVQTLVQPFRCIRFIGFVRAQHCTDRNVFNARSVRTGVFTAPAWAQLKPKYRRGGVLKSLKIKLNSV
jgi:hypothetical protein